MLNFKEFYNESPINLYGVGGLPSKDRMINDVKNRFDKDKLSNKLFSDFKFYIDNNIFYVGRDDLDFFIVFDTKGSSMFIKVIQNLSNEKELSFKIYSAILHNKIFNEIITGDSLSTQNIKARMKAIQNGMKLFLRKDNKDTLINIDDINKIMKNDSDEEVFVLKESARFKKLQDLYNINIDEFINNI